MLKSWIIAGALGLAIVGTQSLCDGATPSNRRDCQSPLDAYSELKPIDKAVTVNKSVQCTVVHGA